MNKTGIEYLDYTYNPIAMRCTKVSEGCANCWHLRMADRLAKNPTLTARQREAYAGGEPVLLEDELEAPLRRKKPSIIGINFMGDIFHSDIPLPWIDKIMAMVSYSNQHTFIILTKRPSVMAEYFMDQKTPFNIQRQIDTLSVRIKCERLKEEWRDVVGYEGLYRVSNQGRIESLTGRWTNEPYLLKGALSNGYIQVLLSKDKIKTSKRIHAIVLEAFVGPPKEGEEGCHLNGDRSFNWLPNLRWGSKKDNHSDTARHGMAGTWMKGNSSFTPEQILEIRRRRNDGEKLTELANEFDSTVKQLWKIVHYKTYKLPQITWPLPNLWIGVTAEDQHRADERIPILLQIPAAVRFVSFEPLLSAIDLKQCGAIREYSFPEASADIRSDGWYNEGLIDWAIVGGETGPGTRPMHPAWARSLRDQCVAAGVPYFFKHWGEWLHDSQVFDCKTEIDIDKLNHCHSRPWPDGAYNRIYRVGKRTAGHLLDGQAHRQLPKIGIQK